VVDDRRHRERVTDGPDDREVLLGPQHEAGDGGLAGLAHRGVQQLVRLRRGVARDEVVRRVEVEGSMSARSTKSSISIVRDRLRGRAP
jgi:hypothetical protein